MNKTASFRIFNASAGSGKTFTLVKEYLSCLFQSKNTDYYQHLLAITFTNKAVAEMKQRILSQLVLFSCQDNNDNPPEMLLQIAKELELNRSEIQIQSKKILKHLLHHYASFSVETIDRFNHRLIRTFARDLKLTSNFEVSLDTPQLLAEAVDQLLSKAGEDKQITQVLVDFALEKTDDDRSWDISKDIAAASALLFKENDMAHLAALKDKNLDDFSKFKKELLKQKKEHSVKIRKLAKETLQLIDESGLEAGDFSGGYLPKYFNHLSSGNFAVNLNSKWQTDMEEKPLYPKRVDEQIQLIINELTPIFVSNFKDTKKSVRQFLLIDSILKNLNPLFVINLVQKEIELIKDEKNILPISEFNTIINTEIRNQPAPFIYERMGEKYRHFFIDEFQDTSLLQWENLKPLIENALSQQDINQKPGSLLLVGDAKQAIYRWRGGLPEQFMSLYGASHPFPATQKTVLDLTTNYRSSREIIDFNNTFFSFIANYFKDSTHKLLYETGNQQKFNSKSGGYLKLEFIEKQIKELKDEVYSKRVYETIIDLRKQGFEDRDICILTRNKKDGILVGTYLMEMGITVISSETLLLESSALVRFILDTLYLSLQPENKMVKLGVMEFIHDHFKIGKEKHTFFTSLIDLNGALFEEKLKEYQIDFSSRFINSLSLYESCEYIIRQFELQASTDAYVYAFMDFVYDFTQKPQANKINFLETWEIDKEKVSLPANEGIQAVQLMTIHKAKGLEFPVVLFPFADIKIYETKKDILWYPLDKSMGYKFDETPINFKKELANYGDAGERLYNDHLSQLELDNLNLLYVALTRAIEQLYIFAEIPSEITDESPSSYNQLFGAFLKHIGKWKQDASIYELGEKGRSQESSTPLKIKKLESSYTATSPSDHNLKIVASESLMMETEIQTAIFEGNLLHDMMSKITSEADIIGLFETLNEASVLSSEEIEQLRTKVDAIVEHPQLRIYYQGVVKVENERDIITASGMLLRPDRINFNQDNTVTLIDYKTGTPSYEHEDQINSYASALMEMGEVVSEKLLVYINQDEIVINKV